MTQQTVLIAGASRGLGLEFARQYGDAGWTVIAGARTPAKADELQRIAGVDVLPLDVLSPDSIADAAAHVGAPLSLLIVNAGVTGARRDAFHAPDDEDFDAVMHTNVLGPMRLIQAFGDTLAAACGTIIVLSSRMGSIADTNATGSMLYRVSKAAANMVVKCAALEYGSKGATVVALHPGWVRTDMGGQAAPLDASDAIAGMRRVIAALTPADNGKFFDYSGKTLPW